MSTVTWTGGADGITFTTAGNWDTGVAPVNGDSVQILTGNSSITAGLAPGISVVNFIVGPQFTGTIGSAGTSLSISVTGTLTYNGRASLCNITAGGSNIAKAKILQTAGQFNLSGGTWTQLEVGQSGNAYVTSSAVVTTLLGTGGNCVAEYNATGFTTVIWGAGRLQSARNLGTLTAAGSGTIVNTTNAATITTATIGGGSRLNHQSSGTITTLNTLSGGKSDAQGSLYSFTVTTSNEYAGNLAIFDNETVSVTKSATNDIGMA